MDDRYAATFGPHPYADRRRMTYAELETLVVEQALFIGRLASGSNLHQLASEHADAMVRLRRYESEHLKASEYLNPVELADFIEAAGELRW